MVASLALRPFEPADVPALRAIYDRQVAPAMGWTEAEAPMQWRAGDVTRARVAVRGDRITGGVALIAAPPWLYVFPLVADDEATAAALLDAALVHARSPGIEHVRLGVRAGEHAKRAAVVARGFRRSIDLIDHVRATSVARAPVPLPAGVQRLPRDQVDRDGLRLLHDLTFEGVPNSGPIPAHELATLLDGADAWPDATGVWADPAGRYLGFVIGLRATDARGRFGRVDAIGVHPRARGLGLARAMLDQLLAQAETDGHVEVRSIIASTNAASRALHERAGFAPFDRREMWDLDAATAA